MGAQCEVAAAKRAELGGTEILSGCIDAEMAQSSAICFDTILKTYYSYFLRSHPSVRPGVSA